MALFPDPEVQQLNLALTHGHPATVPYQGRDLRLTLVQQDGAETAVHCTTPEGYSVVLRDLDAEVWAGLMAQLPTKYR